MQVFDNSMLDLDKASIAGVIVALETIDDTFEKAIVRYDYPYADGADLEDLGQKGRVIRARAHFWDDADAETSAAHAWAAHKRSCGRSTPRICWTLSIPNTACCKAKSKRYPSIMTIPADTAKSS